MSPCEQFQKHRSVLTPGDVALRGNATEPRGAKKSCYDIEMRDAVQNLCQSPWTGEDTDLDTKMVTESDLPAV